MDPLRRVVSFERRSLVVDVLVKVVDRVVVSREDVERVSVNLHISADGQVGRGDEGHVLVHILVLPLVEELAFDDTRVLLGGFVDAEGVVGQVERDDESAIEILRNSRVEPCSEAEYTR